MAAAQPAADRRGVRARRGRGRRGGVRRLGAVQSQDHEPALWSLVRAQRLPRRRPSRRPRSTPGPSSARTSCARPGTSCRRTGCSRSARPHRAPGAAVAGGAVARARARPAGAAAGRGRRSRGDRRSAGPLTRAELGGVFERPGIGIEGQRLPHLLMHAELRGVVCSGPTAGPGAHVRARSRSGCPPGAVPLDEVRADESPGSSRCTYVRSHGPATERDLAWWAGLPVGAVRTALAAARPAVRASRARATGATGWRGAPRTGRRRRAGGPPCTCCRASTSTWWRTRRAAASPTRTVQPGAMPRGGMLSPFVAVDGRFVGSWRRRVLRARGAETVEVAVTCVRAARAACARRAPAGGRALRGSPGQAAAARRRGVRSQIQEGSHIRSAQDVCGMSSAT